MRIVLSNYRVCWLDFRKKEFVFRAILKIQEDKILEKLFFDENFLSGKWYEMRVLYRVKMMDNNENAGFEITLE